jgi:hypothetical protein
LIGFDPAFDQSLGHTSALGPAVTVHAATFEVDQIECDVSLILCLMTLEHIPDPIAFLKRIMALSARNDAAPVVVQVPNASHVLKQGAFWDVHYEHCNYFTEQTLRQCLIKSGAGEVHVKTGFADQYLVATTRSGQATNPANMGLNIGDPFEQFCLESHCNATLWRDLLSAWHAEGRRVALWPAASKAVGFLATTDIRRKVTCGVDINPKKWGTYLPGSGLEVVAPDQIARLGITDVVLLNQNYMDEVSEMVANAESNAVVHSIDRPPVG